MKQRSKKELGFHELKEDAAFFLAGPEGRTQAVCDALGWA